MTPDIAAPIVDDVDIAGPSGEGPEDLGGDPVLDLMAVLEAERDSYLGDLQRVSAEFANFRKQAEKRSVEVAAVARGALAELWNRPGWRSWIRWTSSSIRPSTRQCSTYRLMPETTDRWSSRCSVADTPGQAVC